MKIKPSFNPDKYEDDQSKYFGEPTRIYLPLWRALPDPRRTPDTCAKNPRRGSN